MEEESRSILASLRIWFTPTVLFVMLNLIIGTIALTAHRRHRKEEADSRKTPPSSVLDRVRSIGSLYRYRSGEIPLEAAAPPPSTDETAEALQNPPDPDALRTEDHHFGRSQSEPHPTAEELLEGRMKKSASARSASAQDGIMRRPKGARASGREVEVEEVDAKADDFIDRFRQQLRLQRIDSILRYKEMLNRGN